MAFFQNNLGKLAQER